MRRHPSSGLAFPRGLCVALTVMTQAAPVPALAQRTWDVVLAGAPADGRIPVLSPRTEMAECVEEYQFPDSLALVGERRPASPVWRWNGRTMRGRPNYGWRAVGGASAPDTLRVAVIGPVCDATRRTRPRWGSLSQLLVERDGIVLGVSVDMIRAGRGRLNAFHEVFLLGSDGKVLEARLEDVGPEDRPREEFALRPYDRPEATPSRPAARVEPRTAQQELERLKRRRQRADSVAEVNRRRRAAQDRASRERANELADRHDWSPEMRNLVLARQVAVGMDETMVRAAWGWPEDVNRTTTARGTREQWVYGGIGSRR